MDTYTCHHPPSGEVSWAWGLHCVPIVEHPLTFSCLGPLRSPLSAEVMAGTKTEQQTQTCINVVRVGGAGNGKLGAAENWVKLYLLADRLIPVYEYKMHTFCYTASRNYCGSDYNLPFEIFISSTPITEDDGFLIISDAARCSSLLKLLRKTHKTYVFHCSLYNPGHRNAGCSHSQQEWVSMKYSWAPWWWLLSKGQCWWVCHFSNIKYVVIY